MERVRHEQFDLGHADEVGVELRRLQRGLIREKRAREEAEAIAERGLRDLYLSQQRLDLLQRIATVANQSSTMREALGFTLTELCAFTSWSFGNVYLIESEGDVLVPAGIWHSTDPEGLMPFIDDSLARRFANGEGLPGRVVATGHPHWLSDLSVADNFPRAALAGEVGLNSAFAFPVLVGDRVEAVMEFFARPNLSADGVLLDLVGQIGTQLGRVIEREKFNAKLIFDALHDPLTGLPNRALFMDRAEQALARRQRRPDHRIAVLFIDLDGFKFVNDSLGHNTGDAMLVSTAKRFEAALQSGAAMPGWPQWTLARLGGDEFTVILEDFDDPALVERIADALLVAAAMPHDLNGMEMNGGASIGVTHASSEKVSALDLLRKADTAMYAAKARGRGQVAVFDEALRDRAQQRLQTENDLRRALRRSEFRLLFQPIMDLNSNGLAGFEALLRWERRPGELVGPAAFIDIAEETGLIVMIGEWVLHEACAAAARWHRRYPDRPKIAVSINVSPRQFIQPGFVALVRKALAASAVDPATITLEVTENIAISNPERAIEVMRQIAALGVKISLDDFGTGYSSLGHLHRYPFDTLKLDRSFVSELEGRDRVAGIVRAVLDLAVTMDMRVVAEGIETAAQRNRLRDMGCDFAQGYLYSRPLPADAAERLIAAQG